MLQLCDRRIVDLQLSSVYLYEKIKEKYGMRESAMYQDVPAGYNGIIAEWFTGKYLEY